MSFPTGPSNYQLHIENGITFRYVSAKSRWELWDDSDATEFQLDSETHNRKAADSDLQVQITDNDSDIAYLYGVTVKFRGTIDPTAHEPSHTKIKPGDMYVSYTNGSIRSGWNGVENTSVRAGDALLYTDSEEWVFMGSAEVGDSETIHSVPSLGWYAEQSHTTQRKLYWGSDSRVLFFEVDSDTIIKIPTDTPTHTELQEGLDNTTAPVGTQWIDLAFTGGGPKARGTLRYIQSPDAVSSVSNRMNIAPVANCAGLAVDSEIPDFYIIDSENQKVTMRVSNHDRTKGDIIEYHDYASKQSSRIEYDGNGVWTKWSESKWTRKDQDSDYLWLSGEIASSIGGFRAGTIMAFAMTDLPVGFEIADGREFNHLVYPVLFERLGRVNRLPDLRNQFLRGWNLDSDGFGNSRQLLTQQDEEVGPHTHPTDALRTGGGIQYSSGPFSMGGATVFANTGDETRPVNTSVVYAIAMYDGAAVTYDSEIIKSAFDEYIVRVDSELARIDSDWKRNTDSEIHDRKAADSDLQTQITDNDSDILWLYNRDSDFTTDIDSDILALKSKDSDLQVQITDNDSDIHDLFAYDSDLTKDMDSDLHDLRAKDSDQDIIIKDNDSEIRRMLDSEIHDRKAADSDLQVQITDNDSDIAYLYDVTVKFRGTIDPTDHAPAHTEIKPGDMYVSYTNGAIGSGWNGVENTSVRAGDALLYTDSEEWVFMGSAEIGDSENIHSVPSLHWYGGQSHVTQRKLYWGSQSRVLFFEVDSDVVIKIPTDTPNHAELQEGLDNPTAPGGTQWIDLAFTGAGPKARGTLYYIQSPDAVSAVSNKMNIAPVSGCAGLAYDSEIRDFYVIDSENQSVTMRVSNHNRTKGDIIEYHDYASKQSSRLQYDGNGVWTKWTPTQWIKKDQDSDYLWLSGEIASSIGGFRAGTIMAFAMTDLPVGFEIADGREYDPLVYPVLFERLGRVNRLPDLRNQFLRGWNLDSDGFGNAREVLSEQDEEIQSHTHSESTIQFGGGGIFYGGGNYPMGDRTATTGAAGGNETRPVNTSVVYAIAMYDGAAVTYDSEIIEAAFNKYIVRVDSEIARIDSDWKRNTDSDRHNWKAADSDLLVRIIDNDSDILWLYNRDSDFTTSIDSDLHDLRAKDSDQDIIIKDNDSEIRRMLDSEIHDRKAADSDIRIDIDSDIHWLRAYDSENDSDIQALRDRDSDIFFGKYHTFSVDSTTQSVGASGHLYIDYNSVTGEASATPGRDGWVYFSTIDTLFIVQFGNIVYQNTFATEPEKITRRFGIFEKGRVSGVVQSSLRIDGASNYAETVDAANYSFTSPLFAAGNSPYIRGQIDSDLNLREALDTVSNSLFMMHLLYNSNDSEQRRDIDQLRSDVDSETIERQNNDSDIAYLMSLCLKYRGNLDMGAEPPTSMPPQIGDLYFSYAAGTIQDPEWGPLFGQVINKGQAAVYTDSDWQFFGATGFGGLDDSDLHMLYAADSDIRVRITDNDSDILALKHADSDLSDRISANDSDIAILDSDLNHGKTGIISYERLFVNGNLVFGGVINAVTSGGWFDAGSFVSGAGDAWIYFRTATFPGLGQDTSVVIVDNKLVGQFANPNDLIKEVTFGNGVYKRGLGQTGNFQVTVDGSFVGGLNGGPLIYSDGGRKLIQVTERNYDKKSRGDSDTYQNAQTIVELFDILDSEIHHLESKFEEHRDDTPFVKYDDDSEITVNGIKFSEDSDYAALRWNDDDKTLDIVLSGGPVLQVGQEIMFFAKASEAISNGDVVMFAGAQGDHLLMRKADTTIQGFRPEWIMGVATSDISNNQYGYVTQIGKVRGLDTSEYSEGGLLWLDPDNAGALLDSEPPWPVRPILVAATTRSHANQGSIYVRVTTGTNLGDIHDVKITEPVEGGKHNQFIMWDSDTNFWTNQTIDADFGTF